MELDTLIKVWAILGPVGTAVLSAWWSRRNQLADRKYDIERERENRQHSLNEQEMQRLSLERERRRDLIRETYAKFVSTSSEYALRSHVDKFSDDGTFKPETQEVLRMMNESFNMLSILSCPDVHNAATDVLNLALAIGRVVDHTELAETQESFKRAKHELLLQVQIAVGDIVRRENSMVTK